MSIVTEDLPKIGIAPRNRRKPLQHGPDVFDIDPETGARLWTRTCYLPLSLYAKREILTLDSGLTLPEYSAAKLVGWCTR